MDLSNELLTRTIDMMHPDDIDALALRSKIIRALGSDNSSGS